MKTSDKIKQVERYQTTDGSFFETMADALDHQNLLDLKNFFEDSDIFYARSSGTIEAHVLYQFLSEKETAIHLAKLLYKVATGHELMVEDESN